MCPCGVDHWEHLAAGFQGIVGMMVNLSAKGIKASPEALKKMEEQLTKLTEQIRIQKEVRHGSDPR